MAGGRPGRQTFDPPPGPRVMPHRITMNFGGLRHLLLCPRQSLNCADSGGVGGGIRRRRRVEADLRAALLEDDADRAVTEALIGRLYALNVTHAMVRTIGH